MLGHLGTRTEFDVANKTAQGFSMYALNKKENVRKQSQGVYFRLVSENEEEKRLAFEDALEKCVNGQKSDKVFVLEQEKLKTIPGWPFVYWVSDETRNLFVNNTIIWDYEIKDGYAETRLGMATGDNTRFVRYWWEIGKDSIKFNSENIEEVRHNSFKWFPYMKGGEVNRWYGNQINIVNWKNDGKELKNFSKGNRIASHNYNGEFIFREGLTYSFLTVSQWSVRYMPKGFIFDVAGSSIFPKKTNVYLLLGILNSKISTFLIKVLNPTVNYQVGDIARIPFPDESKHPEYVEIVKDLVSKCISIKREIIQEDEVSWEFVAPRHWQTGILKTLERNRELALYETEISESVYILYDITKDDIKQIENEFGRLPGHFPKVDNLNDNKLKVIKSLYLDKHVPSEILKQDEETGDEENEGDGQQETSGSRRGRSKRYLTFEEICLASGFHPETVYDYIKTNSLEREEERYGLAVHYVSYALGVVMGRFIVEGIEADDDGITVLDEGHSDDTPARIREVLNKVLNERQTNEVITVLGGDLRRFLLNDFFTKCHIPMYKKRPVYWLLRSIKKNYGFYIYNLKFTQDTLYSLIRKYLEPKMNLEKSKLADLHEKKESVPTPNEKREIDKFIAKSEELLDELEAFKNDVQEVIDTGFKPDIDDGVILNMAPLCKLIPWKEPEKYYKELQKGKYEWAHVSQYFVKEKMVSIL